MSNRLIMLGSVLIALISLSFLAAEKRKGHSPGMDHSAMNTHNSPLQEGGQAAFSAIIEIVAMLEQDAKTDWETVDIDGLRSHLLDMHYLILETESSTSVIGDAQIQFVVQGTPASVPSIHRMVPAHSRFIEESRGWVINPTLNDDGATLTITANEASLSQLNALGFYGFMSLDSHHQAHHFQMATGNSH